MLFSQYTLKINGEELPVAANYRTLVITVGDGQTVTIPYIVTPTGFKFYESTVVNEKHLPVLNSIRLKEIMGSSQKKGIQIYS